VCDEGFGDSPALLAQAEALHLRYLAEVPCATQVWPLREPATGVPRPTPQTWVPPQTASGKGPAPRRPRVHPDSLPKERVDHIAADLSAACWQRYRILEGSKGPLVADFAAVRAVAVRDRRPAGEVWVLLRRKVDGPVDVPDLKYYLSNAPADTPLQTLVWLSGMRWPIESCFAECKGELGLDHYELRFWPGWYHHMTLVVLAHHFLVQLQHKFDQREGDRPRPTPGSLAPHDGLSGASDRPCAPRAGVPAAAHSSLAPERGRGAPAAGRPPPTAASRPAGRGGRAALSAPPQVRGVSLPSPAPAATSGRS
jgi:hypothetical protein